MAGHSHSANVKHRKDRVNALKAKVFTKIGRMIVVAAKLGGGEVRKTRSCHASISVFGASHQRA